MIEEKQELDGQGGEDALLETLGYQQGDLYNATVDEKLKLMGPQSLSDPSASLG